MEMASRDTDIRYVCLSDMHLGEEDSLLTNVHPDSGEADPTKANQVMQEFGVLPERFDFPQR